MENQATQPKKLPKLTKKQRGFVNDYIKTENGTQAALRNYDIESNKPEKVASVIAVENLAKPSIINAIEVKRKSLKLALIEKGVDEDFIADKVNALLTATDNSGLPDYTAVDKGLKHATNIFGVVDPEERQKGNTTYNFIFSEEVQDKVKLINEAIKDKLINGHTQQSV